MPEISSKSTPSLLEVATPPLFVPTTPSSKTTVILANLSSLMEKIKTATEYIFTAALSILCYTVNPTFYTCAFFSSVVWAKEANEIFTRIDDVWKAQTWAFRCLTVLAAAFSLEVTFVTTTIFLGCKLGLAMANRVPAMSQTLEATPL